MWKIKSFAISFLIILCAFLLLASQSFKHPSLSYEALIYYQDGSYRHTIQEVKKKFFPASLDYFLLARSYQELKDISNAMDFYSKLKMDDLKKDRFGNFFFESYAFYYSEAMIDYFFKYRVSFYSNCSVIISNLIKNLPSDSAYYNDIYRKFLFFTWKEKNYEVLTNLSLTNEDFNYFYKFAIFMLSNTNFSEILKYTEKRYFYSMFFDISNKINPTLIDHLKIEELSDAFSLFLKTRLYDYADIVLQKHYSELKDYDFFVRNKELLKYYQGKREEAIQNLINYVIKGKASYSTVNTCLNMLYENSRLDMVLSVLKQYIKKYPFIFENNYIKILIKKDGSKELYRYYNFKYKTATLTRDEEKKIFRFFLQKDESLARLIANKALAKDPENLYFLFVSAFFNLLDGKIESAYKKFLKISLLYPYTYEWLISKEYENNLRKDFLDIFEKELQNQLQSLSNLSLKEKLLRMHALKEINITQTNLSKENESIEKLLLDFQSGIKNLLDANSLNDVWIKNIFSFSNTYLFAFNREILNYSENRLKSPSERYIMAYSYYDLYSALNLEGIPLSRLDNYLTGRTGGREYHLLFDDSLKKRLYPFTLFNKAYYIVSNTNVALWILSTFREESHFVKNATSPAGAIGIAQLMPATANTIKKNLNKEEMNYYDFEDNFNIGIYHLLYLIKRYKNNYIYALAAYNAGETTVNRWIKNNKYSNELWVETIEYDETRNYIKKILLTRYFYDRIYHTNTEKYLFFD